MLVNNFLLSLLIIWNVIILCTSVLVTQATAAAQHGMSGILETESRLDEMALQKSELDMAKGQSLEQISGLVLELREQIASRKAQLAPVIKGFFLFFLHIHTVSLMDGTFLFMVLPDFCLIELRPLREKCQELTAEYNQTKQRHDSTAAGLDSSLAKLEQVPYNVCFFLVCLA